MPNKLRMNRFINKTPAYKYTQSLAKTKGLKEPHKNNLHA